MPHPLIDAVCAHGRKLNEMCPGCEESRPTETFGKQFGPSRFDAHIVPLSEIRAFEANAKIGIGGGPTRATILPTAAADRKKYPIATGLLDYFPDALAAISNLSYVGNEQHNPGQPVHWARGKSTDESDTMMRHFLQRGTIDTDGVAHSVKMAWRCLALLQKELETK